MQAEEVQHFFGSPRVMDHSGEENFCCCCELNWVAITAVVLREFNWCRKLEEFLFFVDQEKFDTTSQGKSKVILETMLIGSWKIFMFLCALIFNF